VELFLHSPNTPSWRGAQLKSTGATLPVTSPLINTSSNHKIMYTHATSVVKKLNYFVLLSVTFHNQESSERHRKERTSHNRQSKKTGEYPSSSAENSQLKEQLQRQVLLCLRYYHHHHLLM
jgi:hypothetical protein